MFWKMSSLLYISAHFCSHIYTSCKRCLNSKKDGCIPRHLLTYMYLFATIKIKLYSVHTSLFNLLPNIISSTEKIMSILVCIIIHANILDHNTVVILHVYNKCSKVSGCWLQNVQRSESLIFHLSKYICYYWSVNDMVLESTKHCRFCTYINILKHKICCL